MSATSTLDDRQFRASIAMLAKISGKTYVETFKLAGAGPIIKILARNKAAKPPSIKKIRESVEKKASLGISLGSGRTSVNIKHNKGRTWWRRDSNGGTKWRMVYDSGPSRGWHLGAGEWTLFLAAVKERNKYIKVETARRARSRGLLRMSFIQIADRLAIDVNKLPGPAIGQLALARSAKMPGRLGQGSTTVSGPQFDMIFANFSSGVRGRHAAYWQSALQTAIYSRASVIRNDMARGVFKDMKTRAQRYPGLFVQP